MADNPRNGVDQNENVAPQGSSQTANETDQAPPPPYSACISEDGGAAVEIQQYKSGGGYPFPPPAPPFEASSDPAPTTARPLLPPQPVRVIVDQRGIPISVPPGIQVVVVPARGSRGVPSREEESKQMRSIALPLAILSLFFGSMFCAIPALVCACRRHAPAIDYRKSIALSTIALLIGVTGLVFAAIRANRNAMAYM